MNNFNKNNICCQACGKENDSSLDSKFIRDEDANLILCSECVNIMYDAIQPSAKSPIVDKEKVKEEPLQIPNPKNIFSFLNKHIVNQEEAKKQLSVAIAQHYRRIKDLSIDKSNILIMGPTGTGKTEIARYIAKYLDVPFVTTDATSLTTRGYIGEDTDSVVVRLLQSCNYNLEMAQKGIIFIDEIDKIAKSQNNDSQIATVSIQQELLKIMEGTIVKVIKGGKGSGRGEEIFVNTKNILFICAGSFDGIQDIINGPSSDKTIGLQSLNEEKKQSLVYNVPEKLETEHLLKFGFIPEFLGRLPIVIHTLPLSKEDMFKILTEPANSLIKQYQKMLKIDAIDASFEDEFLLDLVEIALTKKLGARGLRKVLENHLKELFFNIDDYSGYEISIGKEITKKVNGIALSK